MWAFQQFLFRLVWDKQKHRPIEPCGSWSALAKACLRLSGLRIIKKSQTPQDSAVLEKHLLPWFFVRWSWRERVEYGIDRLSVHLCPTISTLLLSWASIIQSRVGGLGRKTNCRHVASRSKTAEINVPADHTAVCLSRNRVRTLGPNTAARFQTERQAGSDTAQRYVPTSWLNKTFGCQHVNLTYQRRWSANILEVIHSQRADGLVLNSAC